MDLERFTLNGAPKDCQVQHAFFILICQSAMGAA
jgi:hypothetical protein